jgi:hypothetical protein
MDDYELQFLVMIEAQMELHSMLRSIKENLSSVSEVSPSSFNWKNNWFQLKLNDDGDHIKSEGADGYLYYKFRLEVSPIENVDVDDQVSIAKELESKILSFAKAVEVCADFEEFL